MKNIDYICRLSQRNVKKYVARELKNLGYDNVISDDGFVFAKGDFPVLICAHMDTVHTSVPSKIYQIMSKDKGVIMSAKEGIGGDDRCGIYMTLKVAAVKKCSILFLEDEEIGCVGASKFIKNPISGNLEFNYIIEFDRKGENDAVFYECDNPEFTDFITKEFYREDFGSMSDISVIAPALGCAAVNLSCGYYNQHTKNEYIILDEMERSIQEAVKILNRTDIEKDKFEYIEAKYTWGAYSGIYDGSFKYLGSGNKSSYAWDDEFDLDYVKNYYADGEYTIMYYDRTGIDREYVTFACCLAEALGNLMLEDPYVCYGDVYDYYVDRM